jgi:hypothetical protein
MKKVLPAIICFALCLAVALIIPKIGTSNPSVDDSGCLVCHDAAFPSGDLHSTHSSFDCSICHVVAGDTPSSANCLACHPEVDSETCDLVAFHDPGLADCLICHPECDVEPTTTTTTDVSTTTTTADVTTTTTTPVTTTTTTVSASNITVSPDTILRSRWIMLPAVLAIQGSGTNFAQGSSKPTYSPEKALIKLPPLVLNAELIWQTVLVNPAWLSQAGNQTVTCTVDEGSDDFDINLLPLILDE